MINLILMIEQELAKRKGYKKTTEDEVRTALKRLKSAEQELSLINLGIKECEDALDKLKK